MPAAVLNGRPARFDAGDADRRAMIAKIHVAKKQLQLGDDDYRSMLFRVAGEISSANCTNNGLRAMLAELRAKGFQPVPRAGGTAPKPADHPAAGKARAMWISLHHLGAIDNPSEQALEAFARRQLKVERMQWANQALMYRLIEALKAIAERNGWSQDLAGINAPAAKLKLLKMRLCEAILAKLAEAGLVPASWRIEDAAWSLLGFRSTMGPLFWELGDYDLIAKGLGAKLRGGR